MLPKEIRKIRKSFGWTQVDMAKMLGVTFQTYNRWERGYHKPKGLQLRSLEHFRAYLKVMNIVSQGDAKGTVEITRRDLLILETAGSFKLQTIWVLCHIFNLYCNDAFGDVLKDILRAILHASISALHSKGSKSSRRMHALEQQLKLRKRLKQLLEVKPASESFRESKLKVNLSKKDKELLKKKKADFAKVVAKHISVTGAI